MMPRPLLLLIPGVIALPAFTLVSGLGGKGIPLSLPTEEAKSTRRGLMMIVPMFVAMGLAGLVSWSWETGWFWWLVLGEMMVAGGAYFGMRRSIDKSRWSSME